MFRDVPAQDFINAYAQFLQRQGKLEVPGYVDIVKTSAGNDLPPQEAETWFYKELLLLLTHLLEKQVGVGALNKLYGGAKTEVSDHTNTLMLPVLSTENVSKLYKDWCLKSLQKVVEESLKTVKEIWTVLLPKLWKKMTNKLFNQELIYQTTIWFIHL